MTAYHSLNLNLGSKRLKNNLKCIFCSYQTWLFKYYMTSQNFPSPPAAPAFHRKMFCCYSLNYHAFPWRKPAYIRNTLMHLDSYITCIVIWCCILLKIFQRTLHVVWQWYALYHSYILQKDRGSIFLGDHNYWWRLIRIIFTHWRRGKMKSILPMSPVPAHFRKQFNSYCGNYHKG